MSFSLQRKLTDVLNIQKDLREQQVQKKVKKALTGIDEDEEQSLYPEEDMAPDQDEGLEDMDEDLDEDQ